MRRIAILALLAAAACSPIGPKTVPRDQFDYNAAIARSAQEQLLLNMVRLRYAETPVFLKVNSVISTYSRVATANAGVGANTAFDSGDTASLGAGFAWSDRPTITYTPISGQEFSQNLLTPIEPRMLFGLMLSGWPVESVLPMTTWAINGIESDIARPTRRRQAEPALLELLQLFKQLREAGAVGLRDVPSGDGRSDFVMFFDSSDLSETTNRDISRLYELLGLAPDVTELRLTYGLVPERPGDFTMLTGSIWEIMLNLAWQFEVPEEHVASGRTGETFRILREGAEPPIRVLYDAERPDDAFVAVQNQGYWFYIDQRDRDSKRAFSFLQLLLSLAETAAPDRSPVVTISN